MYITNTSFVVEPQAQTLWLDMMKSRFLPFLAENGFEAREFCRVISVDAPDHFTYSLQVGIGDMGRYKVFTEEMLGEYAAISGPVFGDSVMWFNSLMKRVEL